MDLCLYAKDHYVPSAEAAEALDLTAEQVQRVYDDVDAKRNAAAYLHAGPLFVEDLLTASV
jgi:NAD+ synthase